MEDTILMVDFNGHIPLRFSYPPLDQRGITLVDEIDDSKNVVINEKEPTRVTKDCQSSPDITIASPSLAMNITWQTERALGSHHLPITVTLHQEITMVAADKTTYINFKKADWAGFKFELETWFDGTQPMNVSEGEKHQ